MCTRIRSRGHLGFFLLFIPHTLLFPMSSDHTKNVTDQKGEYEKRERKETIPTCIFSTHRYSNENLLLLGRCLMVLPSIIRVKKPLWLKIFHVQFAINNKDIGFDLVSIINVFVTHLSQCPPGTCMDNSVACKLKRLHYKELNSMFGWCELCLSLS